MISKKVLISAFLFFVSSAHAGEMDLYLKTLSGFAGQKTLTPSQSAIWSKSTVQRNGERFIPVVLKTLDPKTTIEAVKFSGGSARELPGNIVSAEIPPEDVVSITKRDEVLAVEAALPLSSKMDTARTATSVDVVQNGSALGTAYDGTNVVVGIVDDGLDYGHPDFLNAGGTTRVQYVKQTSNNETKECVKSQISNGSCSITDGGQGTNHGSHVTGIAAGSNSTYTGVAPKADIMFIFASAVDGDTSGSSSSSFSTAVINGVTEIFDKANILNKAAVVNLSLGTSIGAHDGTSILEAALSALTAAKSGRVIVNAAGNEQTRQQAFAASSSDNISRSNFDYIGGIHAGISAAAGESKGSRIAIINGAYATASWLGAEIVDVWLDAGQKDYCSIAVFAYTNGRRPPDFTFPGLASTSDAVISTDDVPFAASTVNPVTASGNSASVSIQIDSSDVRNSKPHAAVLIAPSGASSSVLQQMWFDVVIRASGGVCTGHMWLYPDYVAYHDFLKNVSTGASSVVAAGTRTGYSLSDGDGFYTTTIPATAAGVIAVGSFMPEKPIGAGTSKWTGDNGVTYDQSLMDCPGCLGSTTNDVSSFSSLGPTADGRTKPEIAAPGEPIISTKARNAVLEYDSALTVGTNYFKDAGTSMSSPHITGIVALLLQRNNTLTFDQVKTALRTGASTAGMTSKTADPENSYGAGKVNAAAVLASVDANTSDYGGTGDLPAPESGGCQTMPAQKGSAPITLIILVVLIISAARLFSSRASRPPL